MSDVRAEICFCGEDSDAQMTSLVAGIVSECGVTQGPRGHAVILLEILFDVNGLNDWIHIMDVLRDVLVLRDVVRGGNSVVRGQGHQFGR